MSVSVSEMAEFIAALDEMDPDEIAQNPDAAVWRSTYHPYEEFRNDDE